MRRAEKLKVVARAGSGIDDVDLVEAERKGVKVLRVPWAVADSVAELTIAMMFVLSRGLHRAVQSMNPEKIERGFSIPFHL